MIFHRLEDRQLLQQNSSVSNGQTGASQITDRTPNALAFDHKLSAILNHAVSLLGYILHISGCHCQINMAEKSLHCKWIS